MFDAGLIDMIMTLRGRGISDNSVLRAMELTPRKRFVADEHVPLAYSEQALPIACGQTLSSPFEIALMSQLLELSPEHKTLEVGTGSGYHAAVLSHIAKRVYSVERYHALIKAAEARFKQIGVVNIVTRHGDGRNGWKGQAPFDRILVTCGVKSVPKALTEQLAPGGVLMASVDGQLCRLRKARTKVETETLMPLNLPPLETGKSKVL